MEKKNREKYTLEQGKRKKTLRPGQVKPIPGTEKGGKDCVP